jgi:hypothetical protein
MDRDGWLYISAGGAHEGGYSDLSRSPIYVFAPGEQYQDFRLQGFFILPITDVNDITSTYLSSDGDHLFVVRHKGFDVYPIEEVRAGLVKPQSEGRGPNSIKGSRRLLPGA